MAGSFITIDIDSRQVIDTLGSLMSAMGDLTRPMREVGEYLLLSTDTRYRAEKAPDGTRWAPNADSTLLAYIRRKGGANAFSRRRTRTGGRTLNTRGTRALAIKKILRDSGQLQDHIHYQASATGVDVGTNEVYGATHQFGRGNIPARPFLGLSREDEMEVVEILRAHLRRIAGT